MRTETKNRLTRVGIFFLLVFLINKIIDVNSVSKYYETANNYIMITFGILLFTFVLFKDKESKKVKINNLEVITSLSTSLMFFVFYYYRINYIFVFSNNLYLNVYIDMILFLIGSFSLMISIVGLDLVKRYNKEFIAMFILLLNYVFLSFLLKQVWFLFSNFVIKMNLIFLQLIGNVSAEGFNLSLNEFSVVIGAPCSGIESFATFLGLFGLIYITDMDKIKGKVYLNYFSLGLIITAFLNIFRISLIMMVGAFISPDFAVNMFHENIGWLLFIVFFGAYIYYVYPEIVN